MTHAAASCAYGLVGQSPEVGAIRRLIEKAARNRLPVLLLAMSPTQTLWINLVASITLSIPLAFEVLEHNAMRRPPRAPDEPVFSAFIVLRLVLVATLMTAGACGLFLWEYFRIVGDTPLTIAGHEISKGVLYSLPMFVGGAIYWLYFITRSKPRAWQKFVVDDASAKETRPSPKAEL